MHRRTWIAAVGVALLVLLAPAAAHADHTLLVSKSEAQAGDEVEFQISGTQADESYILKVGDREVASGVDSAGNGVTDKFTMPDLGSSNQSISVEVRITVAGDADHLGSHPMQYVAASSGGPTEQSAPQPAPTVTVPITEAAPGPGPATSTTPKEKPRRTARDPGEKKSPSPTKQPKSDPTGGSTSPGNSTGASSFGSGSSTGGGGSSGGSGSSSDSSPISVNRGPEVPGPSGPSGPVGSSPIASALAPLSGLAEPGKTGFPLLLILLIVLVAAAMLTAVGPRVWQRFEPALPWGPQVDDEVRLGALSRASASGAELQQTIASRRASRSAG